jgi:hypothetical protein
MRAVALPLMLVSVIGASPMAPPSRPPITGFMNAERLSEHCAPDVDSEAAMGDICVGYIAGVADQLMSRQSDLPASKRTVCLPATATIGDIKAAVQAHLAMVQYEPNSAAAVIVERSLTVAFPC